jgi:dephospho-CoA kinase
VSFTVGLTGGIGSGKSTAAAHFARLGARIVDTDAISRSLTGAGGAAMPAIRKAFGDAAAAPDGSLDRDAMRARVFTDPGARRRLEAILHPLIRAQSERDLAPGGVPYSVLVVPLLFESRGYEGQVDRTLAIDVPEALQVERVAARSGHPAAEVRAVMAAQAPRWLRLQLADDVAWNGGDEEGLARQCRGLHERYLALARAA